MRNTSTWYSAIFALLGAFAAAPVAAQPAGPPSARSTEKGARASERTDAKAARPGDRADSKDGRSDEKGDSRAHRGEPGRGPGHDHGDDHAHDHRHGHGPSAASGAPSGSAPGLRHGRHGPGSFRALGFEYQKGKITKDELKERVAAMHANRGERRQRHREGLRGRWGAALAHPACREELRHHARREAFLGRALFLAQTEPGVKDKEKLIARIEKLILQENERHVRAMERLKAERAPAASAAAPGAPAASAVPPAPPAAASAKEGAK